MADMRKTNGVTEIRECRDIDLDGKAVADVADYLIAKAEGLADARLSIETEYNYGDSEIIVCTITGWRPATDAEIRHRQQEEEARVAIARRRAKLDLERIRREHPDLLS